MRGARRSLVPADERYVRQLWRDGARQVDLAKRFGVNQATISRICRERKRARPSLALRRSLERLLLDLTRRKGLAAKYARKASLPSFRRYSTTIEREFHLGEEAGLNFAAEQLAGLLKAEGR